jgi:hypothetical protein
MRDVTGKEIKAGMCVFVDYGDNTGVGLGVVHEKNGVLGCLTYPNNEFMPLSEIKIGALRITKE